MIVIADDITGAAEMAGIAHQHGLSVRLSIAGSLCCDRGAAERTDVLVIATDTRSMTEEEAVHETLRITSQLSPLTSHLSPLQEDGLRPAWSCSGRTIRFDAGYRLPACHLPPCQSL